MWLCRYRQYFYLSGLVVHHERPRSGLDLSWSGTVVQQVDEPREYVYTYM